jgi:excisionase family DNA binding protein
MFPPVEPTWITPASAAGILHVEASTLRKWYKEGRLSGVRVCTTAGGHRRYAKEDIEALAAGAVQVPAPTAAAAISAARHESITLLVSVGGLFVAIALIALIAAVAIALSRALDTGSVAKADADAISTAYRTLYALAGCTLPSGVTMFYLGLRGRKLVNSDESQSAKTATGVI